jgi:protein-disulfide isomerase
VRGAARAGGPPRMRHIDRVIHLPSRRHVACAALATAFALGPAAVAVAAPGGVPGKPPGAGAGAGPVVTPPGRPADPGRPALPGAGGNGAGGRPADAPPAMAVPAGVATPGLAAGTGTVRVHEYVDLGDPGDVRDHQRVVPALMQQVAAEGLGTLVLRPLVLGRDANSVEAAGALIAAARQDRAWVVAGHLVTARISGVGDWITPATLRSIGRSVGGLAVARFVRDATSRSVYPQLNAIRREARAAKVTVTPAFVVKGPRGTRVVREPKRASEVLSAIGEVR